METLRAYINSLSVPLQEKYADKSGTTIGYLRKALNTKPKLDGALCVALEKNSKGAVRREVLRPDIWPERAKRSTKTPPAEQSALPAE